MDTEWISYQIWSDIAKSCGGVLTEKQYPTMIGMTAEETGEYVMRVSCVSFDLASTVSQVWRRVTERITNGIQPLPGAVELIQAFSDLHLPMAIASNSPTDYVETALKGLGLTAYFQYRVGIDQVAEGKPCPDLYLRAAEFLGVDARLCLAVEDSYVGSQSALRAGMRVLVVPSRHDDPAKFGECFGVYPSLMNIREDLDQVLRIT